MNHMIDIRKGKPSASDGEANELCPGRHQMSLGMKDKSTPQSLTGDKIHQWLHDPSSTVLEDYDLIIGKKCLQQREALMDLMWDDWRTNPPIIIQEERLWYRNDKFSGVPDFVAIRDGLCLIADYKTGPIKVANASVNRQLMWLAVLANYKYRFNEVTVSVIQPTCGPPTSHTYDKQCLVKAPVPRAASQGSRHRSRQRRDRPHLRTSVRGHAGRSSRQSHVHRHRGQSKGDA